MVRDSATRAVYFSISEVGTVAGPCDQARTARDRIPLVKALFLRPLENTMDPFEFYGGDDDEFSSGDDQEDYEDFDDQETGDPFEEALNNCGMFADGTCMKAGSEECDWEYPFFD